MRHYKFIKILVYVSVLMILACDKDFVRPSKITITNIKLLEFPALWNGEKWDLTNGPDIYVALYSESNRVYEHTRYFENASPALMYDFPPEYVLNEVVLDTLFCNHLRDPFHNHHHTLFLSILTKLFY